MSAILNSILSIRTFICTEQKKFVQKIRKRAIIQEDSFRQRTVKEDNTIQPEHQFDNVKKYSTTPADLSVAIWKNGIRYYLTPEQYKDDDITGFTVEGLTVLSKTGNFIISPMKSQTNWAYANYAKKYYSDILPDRMQASVISTRYIDINNILSSLGWENILTNDKYLTKSEYNKCNNLIYLSSFNVGVPTYDTKGSIRGISHIKNDGPIIWNDDRNLCLSILKDGKRLFLKDNSGDLSEFDEIEGIAVVIGKNKFIIKLSDELPTWVTAAAAMALYRHILPDKTQAEIISMNYYDINTALRRFGGNPFSENDKYLTKTEYNDRDNYIIDLSSCYGGNLGHGTYGYIRGVKTLTD